MSNTINTHPTARENLHEMHARQRHTKHGKRPYLKKERRAQQKGARRTVSLALTAARRMVDPAYVDIKPAYANARGEIAVLIH